MIVDARVNLNLKNEEEKTPLLFILNLHLQDTLIFIVKQTNEGDTLKKLATKKQKQQIIKLLEEYETSCKLIGRVAPHFI